MSTKLGFVGLGKMGTPIVTHLLESDYSIYVYDVNPKAVTAVTKLGAIAVKSVADVANEADVFITMLQTGEQVKSVCLGEAGAFAVLPSNAIYIDSSSIDLSTSRELHSIAKQQHIRMLDAPVSGGVKSAEARGLTIMVGGAAQDFQAALPILELYGQNIIHTGDAGSGQIAKICNNMLLGISMIGVSEAFVLAEHLGLAPEKLFEVCSTASGQCWSLTKYCPAPQVMEGVPSNNQYQPGFTAAMMLKDLKLGQQAAASHAVETPLGKHAMQLYQQFVDSDHADMDFSGIITMLKEHCKEK